MYGLNKWPEDWRSYNNLALIHQNHCQHGWERFLPWHRIYLYEFEQALQDHCPGRDHAVLGLDDAPVRPETAGEGLRSFPQSFKAFPDRRVARRS